ncbi:protein transport protein HofC [Yersinia ruckeri]|uniref:protein transport protein HofC n=1 Tax=Yersinia ruckeri TaxID=29486 RepID=UPI0022387C61|nr:protein transport protein HofC [Yersinia ruckeri]MCW6623100.1 protein transport protein HofC [Yersinia ruckeri]
MTLRLFIWQGIDDEGNIVNGECLAKEKTTARDRIIQLGIQPIAIKGEQRLNAPSQQSQYLIRFTRHLATLLQAGLPLMNSLQLLATEADTPMWRCLLREIGENVIHGQPLSEAISIYPSIFPTLYTQLIAVAELTGELDKCCIRLAEQQEKQQQLQKKVAKTLRYPAFVCAVALGVSIFMLMMVLPQFAQLYQSLNTSLPGLTLGLLYLSGVLVSYGVYFITALTIIFLTYSYKIRKKLHWQQREQRFLLRLPLIAPLIQGHCLSQIFRTLSVTQNAGLTLDRGLQAAAMSVNNWHYKKAINHIYQLINQGVPLNEALSHQSLFPPLCRQLVRIGEESGSLDMMLEKLANWQQQQTEELADNLTQILEPTLMLIVGIIIGTLVIAMYLPIFQLGGVIG